MKPIANGDENESITKEKPFVVCGRRSPRLDPDRFNGKSSRKRQQRSKKKPIKTQTPTDRQWSNIDGTRENIAKTLRSMKQNTRNSFTEQKDAIEIDRVRKRRFPSRRKSAELMAFSSYFVVGSPEGRSRWISASFWFVFFFAWKNGNGTQRRNCFDASKITVADAFDRGEIVRCPAIAAAAAAEPLSDFSVKTKKKNGPPGFPVSLPKK